MATQKGISNTGYASRRAVSRFLNRFQSADAIAQECRKRNVRARPRCVFSCALAELIQSEFPSINFIRVDPDNSPFKEPKYREPEVTIGRYADIADDSAPLPLAAVDFIEAFDDGEYEDLWLPGLRGIKEEKDEEKDWEPPAPPHSPPTKTVRTRFLKTGSHEPMPFPDEDT